MTVMKSCVLIGALLGLERQPVGIRFLTNKEEYQSFAAEENSNRMSYCTGVRKATQGQKLKMRAAHQACAGGAAALGFIQQTEENISGARRLKMSCYDQLGTSRAVSREMVYCAHQLYGVGILPLQDCDSEPDVVIVVCNAYNAMRLVQGHAYHHGFAKEMKTAGLQAICHDCTSFPYEKTRLNISMLCAGTRMLAGWKADELAVGLPFSLWADMVDGVKNTVNPYERNPAKVQIASRLEEAGIGEALAIEMSHNYDDGCYKGGCVTFE